MKTNTGCVHISHKWFCVFAASRNVSKFLSWGATVQIESRPLRFEGSYITLRHTTLGGTPPDEGSVRRRNLYLTTLTQSQETNTHALGWIRTSDPSKRSAEGPRHRPRGH
jgi:hypothetical protein